MVISRRTWRQERDKVLKVTSLRNSEQGSWGWRRVHLVDSCCVGRSSTLPSILEVTKTVAFREYAAMLRREISVV